VSKAIAYAIRHGETDDNAHKVFRSWTVLPLNARGEEEAKMAARKLKSFGITGIWSSPLPRSMETAQVFAELVQFPIFQDGKLMGWKTGVFEGLLEEEAEDALKLFIENSSIAPPLGESLDDFESRCADFLQEMLPLAEKEGPFAFFTHNSVLTAFSNLIEGTRKSSPRGNETEEPGGIMAFYVDGDGYSLKSLGKLEKEAEIAA
jgi:broad specificity phosphatase PhoE